MKEVLLLFVMGPQGGTQDSIQCQQDVQEGFREYQGTSRGGERARTASSSTVHGRSREGQGLMKPQLLLHVQQDLRARGQWLWGSSRPLGGIKNYNKTTKTLSLSS